MQPDVQSKQVKEELTNTYINVSFLFLLWRSHMICHEREPVLYVWWRPVNAYPHVSIYGLFFFCVAFGYMCSTYLSCRGGVDNGHDSTSSRCTVANMQPDRNDHDSACRLSQLRRSGLYTRPWKSLCKRNKGGDLKSRLWDIFVQYMELYGEVYSNTGGLEKEN